MNFKVMPRWCKQAIAIAGLFLALPGILIGFGLLCLTLILIINQDTGAIYAGLIGFTLFMLSVGTGGATFWHSVGSLNEKISKPLRLPPIWGLGSAFALYFVVGVIISQSDFVAGLFLPPILLTVAAIPPLMAVVWFSGNRQIDGMTWRRGLVAFVGATTLILVIFFILQLAIFFVSAIFSPNPAEAMVDNLELVFEGLFEQNGISRILDRRFAYLFVQLTIIIPLIGALAKPLVTLPLLGQLSRQETFLLGAIAGAGVAALESLLFVSFGLRVWTWILIIQALGAAIHPLGSGLIALGWRDVVRSRPNPWPNWLACFSIAMVLHMLWNLGFLLVIAWDSIYFFAGIFASTFLRSWITTLLIIIVLVGLGVCAPWAGRSITQHLSKPLDIADGESDVNRLTLIDRGITVWAFVSLIAVLPIGIIGLQGLLR